MAETVTRDELAEVCAITRRYADDTDRQARFPVEALDALRSTGLLGMSVPARFGGRGASLADVLRVTDALSRECMSVGMIFVMHCQQVAGIVEHARSALQRSVLPRIAAGELYLGSITTEVGTGGHLLSSQSQLGDDDGSLVLDRFAPVVTGGAYADAFLVTMQAPGATSSNAVSLVYAERDQLTISVAGDWDPVGMRATHSIPLKLTGSVPADQVVGEHGRFRDIAVRTFGPWAHVGWATSWLGAADGALARSVRELRSSGKALDSELLRYRLSRIRQRSDTVHALITHAVQLIEQPDVDVSSPPRQLLLNAVKLTASEQCLAMVEELIDAFGIRHGYLRGSPLALERAWRDLQSASLNYSNDRLHQSDGSLVLMDPRVSHVG
jgi:acyl-CoA dehydrogenase